MTPGAVIAREYGLPAVACWTRPRERAGDRRCNVICECFVFSPCRIEAIAQEAQVSAPSVYAIFKSKTGILRELLDQAGFGPDYESAAQRALSASDPVVRLRLAAPIARGIHESQSAILDLLRGAGVVAPELARLERQKEGQRYERQEGTIALLRSSGKLRAGLHYIIARDIFWALTGRDLYRMLVREPRMVCRQVRGLACQCARGRIGGFSKEGSELVQRDKDAWARVPSERQDITERWPSAHLPQTR
jgi:AcrR family transcriptional regulator